VKKTQRPFFNRELSWLEFNQRVLEEACLKGTPALERVKFLAITASNLDEFFMVRVGGLIGMRQAGSRSRDAAGLTPKMQLEEIEAKTRAMVTQQYACFRQLFDDELPAAGMRCLRVSSLLHDQEARVMELFHEELFPILSPMVIPRRDEGEPVPVLKNLGLHVAARLRVGGDDEDDRLAVIPIAEPVERIVQLPAPEGAVGLLFAEDIVKRYIKSWFPGQDVIETAAFRITRNADMAVREDEAPDLIAGMEDVLQARK
jgi:polyphosphate kinase